MELNIIYHRSKKNGLTALRVKSDEDTEKYSEFLLKIPKLKPLASFSNPTFKCHSKNDSVIQNRLKSFKSDEASDGPFSPSISSISFFSTNVIRI
jgi:hypothetical protein